jgi:hypothetical protein
VKAHPGNRKIVSNLQWSCYPKYRRGPDIVVSVIDAFRATHSAIDSAAHSHNSDGVLALEHRELLELRFNIEGSKDFVFEKMKNDGAKYPLRETDATHAD